jgi:hypothetical protein
VPYLLAKIYEAPTADLVISALSGDKCALFDAGGLRLPRLLEPFGVLWIHLALGHRPDRDNAFAYLA